MNLQLKNFLKLRNFFSDSQGSVLGPLLFLIYINDICNSSKVFNFFLFVDDTNLLYANKSLKTLESVVNFELREVCKWLINKH